MIHELEWTQQVARYRRGRVARAPRVPAAAGRVRDGTQYANTSLCKIAGARRSRNIIKIFS